MIQNFFKIVFPVSVTISIINVLSSIAPLFPKYLSWLTKITNAVSLDKMTPIFTSLLLLSIGYYIAGKVYNKNTEGYDDVRHLALSAIFAIPFIPVIFSPGMLYPYITGKGFGFRFLSIVLLLSFVYVAFTNKNFRFRLTPLTGAFTAFVLLIGISNVLGLDFAKSFWGNFERMDGYLTLLSLWSLVIGLTSLRLKDVEWLKLGKTHVAVASFVTGLGAVQYLAGMFNISVFGSLPILGQCISYASQGVYNACKVDSTLGNSIYLGIYGGLTAWIVLYYIVRKNFQVSVWVWAAFALNILTPFYLTVTRSVWLGIGAGAVVSLLTYFFLSKNMRAFFATIAASVSLLVLVFVFTYFQDKTFIQNIPFLNRLLNVNTLFARWQVWQIAFTSFIENPIFGWGQESFINAFNKNFNPLMYGQEVYFDHPHNSYIGWLFMGGILGFIAYIGVLISGLYSSIKSYGADTSDNGKLSFAIVLGAITTYLIHSFFVFDNLTTSLLIVFMFVYFGRNFAYGNIVLGDIGQSAKKGFSIGLATLGLLALFITFWKPIYANKTLIDAMSYESRATTPVDAISGTQKLFEKGLSLNTFGSYEILEQFLQKSLRYEALARQTKDETIKTAISNFKNSANSSFINNVNAHPNDHRSRFALGLYYTSLGDFENAKKYLTEALTLAPNKQIPIISLAKVLLVKGEKEEAFKLYQKALDVTPKPTGFTSNFNTQYNSLRIEYIKALMLDGKDIEAVKVIQEMLPVSTVSDFQNLVDSMTQIYVARQDIKGIVALLTDAIRINPSNPNYYVWLAQALVYAGEYQAAIQAITPLNMQYPDVVNQFTAELNQLVQQKNNSQRNVQQQVSEPVKTETKAATTTSKK
jgi:tetratricopeptide (TPR) repeat protein/O-antigen ligase